MNSHLSNARTELERPWRAGGQPRAAALSNGKNVEAVSAIALGLAGDASQATRLAADLAKRFPEYTITQFEYLPMIHAAVALQSGSATKALEALAPAAPYELGSIGGLTLYPVYLRGEAYLAAHQGRAAAAEFQKIVDHPGIRPSVAGHSLAKLGLGRAYVMTGDAAKPKLPIKTSSPSGKTPTPTSPS